MVTRGTPLVRHTEISVRVFDEHGAAMVTRGTPLVRLAGFSRRALGSCAAMVTRGTPLVRRVDPADGAVGFSLLLW